MKFGAYMVIRLKSYYKCVIYFNVDSFTYHYLTMYLIWIPNYFSSSVTGHSCVDETMHQIISLVALVSLNKLSAIPIITTKIGRQKHKILVVVFFLEFSSQDMHMIPIQICTCFSHALALKIDSVEPCAVTYTISFPISVQITCICKLLLETSIKPYQR